MPDAVIVGGVRTPFVKAGGVLNETPAAELGRLVAREILDRLDVDASQVDELIAGNVATPADAANVARVIALRAGIPIDRIAHTVSRNCASGMESVTQAVERIRCGQSRCVLALGVDSMSNVPVYWSKRFSDKLAAYTRARGFLGKLAVAAKFRPGDLKPQIGIQLGLTDPVSGLMMGETAEKLAREYHISRDEQDAYALQSHQRTVAAWNEDRLSSETMTVYPRRAKQPVTRDVGPRENQSLEALARLKPFFDRRWGTVTIGNSCQVTDGGVALLLMDAELAGSLGLRPLGRIRAYAHAGCDPARMGLGPVFATARALKQSGLRIEHMELVELNEAFAAQVLACLRCFETSQTSCPELEGGELLGPLDPEKLNVNGGAIALGHPVGATGTRLILTLLEEMTRRDLHVGLATLCVGGGQGGAVIVERVEESA